MIFICVIRLSFQLPVKPGHCINTCLVFTRIHDDLNPIKSRNYQSDLGELVALNCTVNLKTSHLPWMEKWRRIGV